MNIQNSPAIITPQLSDVQPATKNAGTKVKNSTTHAGSQATAAPRLKASAFVALTSLTRPEAGRTYSFGSLSIGSNRKKLAGFVYVTMALSVYILQDCKCLPVCPIYKLKCAIRRSRFNRCIQRVDAFKPCSVALLTRSFCLQGRLLVNRVSGDYCH